MIFSWNFSVITQRFRLCSAPKCLCFFSENSTFCDLSVVRESAAQRDGDRRQVGYVVAVAVHSAVPAWADCLRGQTGAVEARIWEAPNRCASITVGHRRWRQWQAYVQKPTTQRSTKPQTSLENKELRLQAPTLWCHPGKYHRSQDAGFFCLQQK